MYFGDSLSDLLPIRRRVIGNIHYASKRGTAEGNTFLFSFFFFFFIQIYIYMQTCQESQGCHLISFSSLLLLFCLGQHTFSPLVPPPGLSSFKSQLKTHFFFFFFSFFLLLKCPTTSSLTQVNLCACVRACANVCV